MLFTSPKRIQSTGVNYKSLQVYVVPMWYLVQGYSFVGDNTQETLIVYCII